MRRTFLNFETDLFDRSSFAPMEYDRGGVGDVLYSDNDGENSYPVLNLSEDAAGASNSGGTTSQAALGSVAQLADYLVKGFWQDQNTTAHHWASHTVTYNITGLTTAEQF